MIRLVRGAVFALAALLASVGAVAAQVPPPPAISTAAAPGVVNRGDSVLLTVALVSDRPFAAFGVSADLRSIGGGQTTAFNDGGSEGDVVAGDRVYSRRLSTSSAGLGTWQLPVAVSYDYGLEGFGAVAASIVLTVGVPPTASGAVAPAVVTVGDSVLLTVSVAPRVPPAAGTVVEADTGHIGHNTIVPLVDDGTVGDAVAGDRIFSRRVTIRGDAPEGATIVPVLVSDLVGATFVQIPLTVVAPTTQPSVLVGPPPGFIRPHDMLGLSVEVIPGTGPPSTGLVVTMDLSPFGLSSRAMLANDGLGTCDAFEGDRIHTACLLVPGTVSPGTLTLTGQVADAQGRVVPFTVALPIAPSLDSDADGMSDTWELHFGVNDPSADPDADGLTNAQELAAGTHPRGIFRRYLAEGAANDFFRTRLALFNPSEVESLALVRVQPEGRPEQRIRVAVAPRSVRHLTPADLRIRADGPFSTLVESDRDLVVDRTMTWGTGDYGGHVETAIAAPSTTWYFAEGATGWRFSLFYLLQNPGDTPAEVLVHYLRAPGEPALSRTYMVPPRSRRTIPVDDEEFPAGSGQRPLAAGDIAARIEVTNGVPIVAERAMYLSPDGQPFGAGHGGMGATAPATRWTFAEGATGSYFDEYVLLANPGSTPATVQLSLTASDGAAPRVSQWTVPADSRRTIHVDALLGLDCCSVAAEVLSDAPIVAERVMWWPGASGHWREGHVSLGATATSPRWAIAGLELGGPRDVQSFVLVSGSGATVRAYTRAGDAPVTCHLPTAGRQTVALNQCTQIAGRRMVAVVVEGAPDTTVEWATYSGDGVGAGGAALAVPIP